MLRLTPAAMRAARRIREDEGGFTLVEMLTGITIGLIVTFAAWQAVDAANQMQARTAMRVEATNRGRTGMEAITRAIRAQQCFNSLRPMLWASSSGMEFYASISPEASGASGKQRIERHRLEWVANTQAEAADIGDGKAAIGTYGDIYEYVYWGTEKNGAVQWPTTPNVTNRIATGVRSAPDRRDPTGKTIAPIFRYFKYASTTGSGRIDLTAPVPMNNGAVTPYNKTGVASAPATDLNGIVLIEVSYQSVPRKTSVAKTASMNFYNTVSVRIADPTNPAGSPQCL